MPSTPVEQYVSDNLPYAEQTSQKYGVPVATVLAAGGVETGWGKSVVGHNHFGIKGTGAANTTDAQTDAAINQKTYNSPQESFDDYGKFLTENSRYKNAFQHKDDPKAFATEVAKAGYSEKPEEYQKALTSTIDTVNGVLQKKSTDNTWLSLSPSAENMIAQNGKNTDEYLDKLIADIEKGGDAKFNAYKSYYRTTDLAKTDAQKSTDGYVTSNIQGAPMPQSVISTWQDFTNSFGNGLTSAWTHVKEAGAGLEHKVGITNTQEFSQQTNEIQKDAAYNTLRLSKNAKEDPLSLLPDGSINWHGLAASFGSGMGTMAVYAPAAVAGAVIAGLTGGAALPEEAAAVGVGIEGAAAASALTATDIGSSIGTGILASMDGYGSGYEEGLKRGLTNDQASTYGSMRGMIQGALFAVPAGVFAKRLTGAAVASLGDKMLDQLIEGKFTKEAFASALPEVQDGVGQMMKRRLANVGKEVLVEGGTVGSIMALQNTLDHIATVQYAQYAKEHGKFEDVLNKTNEDVFKESVKAGFMGFAMGGIMAMPTIFKSAAHATMYGYVEENVGNPQKLEALKNYIQDYGQKADKNPEQIKALSESVDKMADVAKNYGKLIKSPDARYQIFDLNDKTTDITNDTKAAQDQMQELAGKDPAIVAPELQKWTDIIGLNQQKQTLIEQAKVEIGTTKKPVDYAALETGLKTINTQITERLKPEEKSVEATDKQPDPFEQKQPEVKKAEPETDLDKVFGTGKPVTPKTVKDVLDVPITMGGTKGFLSINADTGDLEFTSESGKAYVVTGKAEAEKYLNGPLPDYIDVDQGQLKQKMQAEQVVAKQEAEKKTRQPVPIESLNGKAVTYKGKKGTLTVDEGGKTSFETNDGRIYDISTEQGNRNALDYGIEPRKVAEPTVHNVEEVSENTATVNGQKYNVHVDEKGNISGLSPFGEPTKVIKNEKLLTAVEIARNKQVDRDIVEALKEPTDEQTTTIAESTAAGLTEPDIEAINEADQLIQGVSEVGRAENEGEVEGAENGGTENKPADEPLAENAQGTQAEGAENAAPEGDKAEANNKGTESAEPVKKGDGNEVAKSNVGEQGKLFQKLGGKPIEKATVSLIDRTLKKAFPNIKTSFLSGEEFDAKHGEGSGIGVTNPDGTVDINTDKITGQTQVHEMGHVWTSWAKKFAPDLYKRGMELASEETGIHEAIKADGYDLEGNALHEETLARMIGESGEKLVGDLKEPTTLSDKAKAWVGEMWQKLSNYVKNRLGLKDTRFDHIQDMPFKDFTAAIARELVNGNEISPISSEDVSGIEKDGVSRFQLTNEEDKEVFAKPVGHIGVPIKSSSAISSGLHIMRGFRDILGNGKNVEVAPEHVTKAVDYLNQKVQEYSKHVLKNPDGTDKNLAGSAWIKILAEDMASEKTRTAIEELLKEQAATGKRKRTGEEFKPENLLAEIAAGEQDKTRFQFSNLSKDAQRIIRTIGNFEVLSDRVNLLKGRLLYNVGVVALDPEADKLQANKFVQFHSKIAKYANTNKYTRKAFRAATEYFLNVADQGTWAYMLDGNGDGMYSRGFRSYEKGVSAAFRIKQAASALIKPLTDISSEGLKSTLNKSAGATTKEVFKDNVFMPDIKLTNGELNSIYGILQADDVQQVLNKEEGAGLEGIKPAGIKLRIQEFGDERKAQTITVYKKDFEDLKAHLGQDRINKIRESSTKTAEYLHSKENPVHESLTGLSIPIVQGEEGGENFYYPRLNISGHEEDLENYTKKQSYINDLAALKARDPKEENLYLVQEPAKVWDSRIRQGSEYSEMALPSHNMDVLMGYGRENMLKLDMNRYIDYNSKFQQDLSNPDNSGSAVEKYIISHFALATIGANPFVNLKHLSTIPLASGVIPMKYLARNLANAPKTYAEQVRNYDIFSGDNKHASPIIDEMTTHSDFANARVHGFTSELQLEAAGVGGKIRVPNGLKDGKLTYTEMSAKDAMIPLKTAETSFGAVVWGGAKDMVKEEYPHLQEGTKDYWNQVDRLYTDAIVASQPSFDQIHRPLYTKGGFSSNPRGVINKTLSLFSGQIMAAFNFGTKKGVDLVSDPTPRSRAQFAKAVTNIFVANAILVAGVNMVRQKTIGSDADKTTYGGNFLKTLAGEFPIFGPIFESIVSKYQNGIFGQDLDYPTVGVLNETAKGLSDALKGNEGKGVKELAKVGAQLGGIPQVPFKLAGAAYDKVKGE